MSTNSDKKIPILPFDVTFGENFTLYKEMKYIQDRDLSEKVGIRKESGNVCKYYTTIEAEPIKIGENQPDTEEE
jgi:hypothetical protein